MFVCFRVVIMDNKCILFDDSNFYSIMIHGKFLSRVKKQANLKTGQISGNPEAVAATPFPVQLSYWPLCLEKTRAIPTLARKKNRSFLKTGKCGTIVPSPVFPYGMLSLTIRKDMISRLRYKQPGGDCSVTVLPIASPVLAYASYSDSMWLRFNLNEPRKTSCPCLTTK